MAEANNQEAPDSQGSGFDRLAEQARVDSRMSRTKDYTADQRQALLDDLLAYQMRTGKKGKSFAAAIGIAPSTLTEVRSGKYSADSCKFLRKIDEFLERVRLAEGRPNLRAYASTRVSTRIYGVYRASVAYGSMALVSGPSGSGKTITLRAIAADHEGVAYIRLDESSADARGLSLVLCRELKLPIGCHHRRRCLELAEYLQKNRNLSILIDEAQKLTADGIEFLRDIHDHSDPEGERRVPMLLAGDEGLYKLVVRTRGGEKTPMKPQVTRRLYPVLNLATDGVGGDGGADLFSLEDVLAVLRNERLRLVSDEGARWLCQLANVTGWGSLGFAMAIAAMALDIATQTPAGVVDLRRALQMAIGPRAVRELDGLAGGSLLKAVG